MSTRTIIEINHDHLESLKSDLLTLHGVLCGSRIVGQLNNGETPEVVTGIRILAQRHHSDTLVLTIK